MTLPPRRSGWFDLLLYLAFVAGVLLLFLAISGTKAPRIPADPDHAGVAPEGCPACHSAAGGRPLPDKHPPKPQCRSCHQPAKAR